MTSEKDDLELINKLLEIYDQKYLGEFLNHVSPDQWCRETINRWVKGKASPRLSYREFEALQELFPKPPLNHPSYDFDFVDLFAGIGGIRRGFELAGGRCVFTSEWNKYAIKTYKANHYSDPEKHTFNEDIREVTLCGEDEVSEAAVVKNINSLIPDHEVLLAGFPCQPFSIAGVSKKNSLGKAHGFECKTQGTLFFDVAKIIEVKRPAAFLLENVKNLKSHDKGKTFKVIMETLEELGYWVADVDSGSKADPKVIDAQNFVPQHRERIVLVGFRKDLNVHDGFSLKEISKFYPKVKPKLGDILDADFDEKYILTPRLWEYLFNYSIKHRAKGNGFGYGLVGEQDVTRTLSARYYKDGSEILIDRGFNPDKDFYSVKNQKNRPRRLTPRECARLMGYDEAGKANFNIPVSDMQAYKQFGNSVVVPVFAAVAKLMKPRIKQAIAVSKKTVQMTDVHSPAVRSKNMQAIRSKNTRPEITVRSLLHAAGFRYRLHVSDLPGKPDLVFPKYRAVIMVIGCFWHGHDCQFFKLPSTRTDFWKQKIEKNRANDKRSSLALRSAEWRVAIVWECALRKKKADGFENVTQELSDWLRSSDVSIELPAAEPSR